jgi:dinuclear metal center YbgI/SA1388 family protein
MNDSPLTLSQIIAFLEKFAPLSLAADWDNVGLLLGDADQPAERILTCLTVTPEVVAEAVAQKAALIVSHHPVLFKATKKLNANQPEGRLLLPLLQAGIAVYSPHTAFDNCTGGINDGLAKKLHLQNISPLRSRDAARECKLVVFVPDADLDKVSEAVFAAGAGRIGQYEQCSFRLPGTGTFFGTENTNPVVGQKGRRETVSEWRLEVVVPEGKLRAVVAAMRQAHSYEEVAFDVYPLKPQPGIGEGRVGTLSTPLALKDFALVVKQTLKANGVQWVGDGTRSVSKVAIACGAAGEFLQEAIRAKADVFLTGEVRFHDGLTAEQAGVALVLPGHYATERPAVEDLAEKLAITFPNCRVWASHAERDPFACG